MSLLLSVVVGLAVWLAVPPGQGALGPPAHGSPRRLHAVGRAPALGPILLVAVVAGVLLALVKGTVLALGLIAAFSSAGTWRMTARARARKAAEARADSVVEACESLAGELRAGQPPLVALRHCVEVCPMLGPVAAAADLGADVPTALRRMARHPGAAGLADVAAAWQVSHEAGGTMALALGRVADASRARRATERLVASELGSAQATARLVAALPVVVLLMGSGLGGDPWGFLFTTPPGLTCLGAGLALAYLGLAWIERIAVTAVGT